MKVPLAFSMLFIAAVTAQDATPPVLLEPSALDSASATTPHPAPVELPHAIAQPIALRIVGSNVKNPGGEYLGRIDNVVIDGESARAEYAMLVVNYPTNTSLYTPVPWGALNYVWDQAQSGGVPGALQVFLLNIDKAALERAPTVDQTQWRAIRQPELARQLAAFYGPTDASAIGSSSPTVGIVAGEASGGPALAPATGVGGTIAPADGALGLSTPPLGVSFPFFVAPGFVAFDTNFIGTNIVITTNVIVTNVIDGIETNVVINLTNFPPQAFSNILSGNISAGTNMAPGTAVLGRQFPRDGVLNTPFPGGTNRFGAGSLPVRTNSFAGTPGFPGNRFPARGVITNSAVGPGPLPGASLQSRTTDRPGVGAPAGRLGGGSAARSHSAANSAAAG
jgi:hypothetical protein